MKHSVYEYKMLDKFRYLIENVKKDKLRPKGNKNLKKDTKILKKRDTKKRKTNREDH